jgi:hypothetical protein
LENSVRRLTHAVIDETMRCVHERDDIKFGHATKIRRDIQIGWVVLTNRPV